MINIANPFQVHMKDEEMLEKANNLLGKCQGKLMYKLGKKITQGEALIEIFKVYAELNGFDFSKSNSQIELIKSDPEEMSYIKDILQRYEKLSSPQLAIELQDYLDRIGISYMLRKDHFKEDLIAKFKEAFTLD